MGPEEAPAGWRATAVGGSVQGWGTTLRSHLRAGLGMKGSCSWWHWAMQGTLLWNKGLGWVSSMPKSGQRLLLCLVFHPLPCQDDFFFFLNQSQGKMNGKQLSTLPLPTVHLHLMTHWFLVYVFAASFVYFRKQPLKHTGSFGSRRSRAATC